MTFKLGDIVMVKIDTVPEAAMIERIVDENCASVLRFKMYKPRSFKYRHVVYTKNIRHITELERLVYDI